MANEKVENYYKILGTTANIGQGRVKEKYIKAVKKHPPETDPEGFEKVRRAYETLKDPTKRKEYDLHRKYGDKIEKLIEKAFYAIEKGNTKQAEDILEKADKISPDNVIVKAGFMQLAGMTGDLEKLEKLFEEIITSVSDPEELSIMYSVKANVLYENDYINEAIETFIQGKERVPEQSTLFALSLATLYFHTEQFAKAMKTMESSVPEEGSESLDDARFFITWIEMVIMAEEWSVISKVLTKFKKYLKNLTRQEDRNELYDELMVEYEENYEQGQFREAEIFIDLVKFLSDNNDSEIKQLQSETKKMARLQKEMDKLARDEDMFPLIYLKAFEWFYRDIIPPEELYSVLNEFPSFMIEELEEEKEGYAAGIVRLRKKYPLLYKQFKKQLDNLFAELTEGFNRQMRRDLRKIT